MFRRFLIATILWLSVTAPASAAVELDGLIDRNLDALMARQLTWGGFDDPLSGPQFNYGAVGLAWVAGERDPTRRAAAAVTLRVAARVVAPGAFQIWLEALAMSPGAWLDPDTRAALATHLRAFREPIVGARALPCHVAPRCYNNLKLVDAVATLQLVRTGLTSSLAGARLSDPTQAERAARALLSVRVPAVQHPDLRIVSAEASIPDAAVLSDPGRNPLAYHALSTAMLVRAVRLIDESPNARRAARRALWALVGLADPRGSVAWMGRGQENTWTLGASTYAAVAGAAEFVDEPALAARLRRLADLNVAELRARSGTAGLAMLPGSGRSSLAGADRSQNSIVSNGLALSFLHLASLEAAAADGPSVPLPAEVAGSVVLDPTAAGVAAIRGPQTWFAVHRAATHPRDARYDVGLLAANVLVAGSWVPVVGQRPNTDAAAQAPTAGPVLVRGGRTLVPAGRLSASARTVVLRGAWRGAGRSVPAMLRFAATARGVRLRTPCPRGYALRLVEWTPAGGGVARPRGLELPDRAVTFSTAVRTRPLPEQHASAMYEQVSGMALETHCRGRAISIEWATAQRPTAST